MNYRKQGLRAFGLAFVAVLGLMAFMAIGAQANWLVLDPGVVEPEVTVAPSAETEGNLYIEKETKLEILCAVIEPDSTAPIVLLAASTIAHGHLIFKTCKTFQNGVNISANCTPAEPILAGGLAEIILHNSENWVLFKPLFVGGVEQNFAQIKFKSPCALPATNNVKGSFVVECGHLQPANTFVHLDCKNHQVTQLIRQNTTLFTATDGLKYGTKDAIIKGIAAVKISSPALYAGKGWGGHV